MKRKTYLKNKHNYNTVIKKLKKKENYNLGNNIYEIIFATRDNAVKINIPVSKWNSDESDGALFLGKLIGGNIIVREEFTKETYKFKQKNPDYVINGKYWDLKTIGSTSNQGAIKRGVKAKAHQIKNNPGGILLDISLSTIPNHVVRKQIVNGMKDTSISNFKVIAERKNYVIAMFYKK